MTVSNEWTTLARYIGSDGEVHLGQPVDASVDVGLAVAAGEEVKVRRIEGDIYTGRVTSIVDVIKEVRLPSLPC